MNSPLPAQAQRLGRGEVLSDAELRQVRERAKTLERVTENLKQEIATIDVLVQHMLADLRQDSPARLAAAIAMGEAVQRIAETYR